MFRKFIILTLILSTISCERFKRNSNSCGIPSQSTSLVIGGDEFPRGSWPWMVALMNRNITPPELFCGGILVSENKVLTGK
jgi:secreted trypsin-like serine protease